MFGPMKIEVPAGTLAVVHHDMFHRQCRHDEDAVWRPMIKMGAVRVAEPLPSDLLSERFENALHNEVAGWLSGTLPSAGSDDVTALAAEALDAASEVSRFDAACGLGQLARSGSAEALGVLMELFCGEAERGRRSALLGAGRAGLDAVAPLLQVLAHPPELVSADGFETQAHVAVDAAYAVGQALLVAAAAGQGPLLPACANAVDGLAAAIGRAFGELTEFAAKEDPEAEEPEGIVFYPLERRRMMAEAACSIGLIAAAVIEHAGNEEADAAAALCGR